MISHDAALLDARQQQTKAIMKLFRAAGCAPAAPAILQPAGPFLDRLGEPVRARTYVFTDPSGQDLCLRPDLTIPLSRLYLADVPGADAPRRYCCTGPVFRYRAGAAVEFEQAGVEFYGMANAAEAEAEVLRLTGAALATARLPRQLTCTLGDLGLFSALLEAIDMPARWRRRLGHQFWRPQAFHALLDRLAAGWRGGDRDADLMALTEGGNIETVAARIDALLRRKAIPLTGQRGTMEIAARLIEKAADHECEPLAPELVSAVEDYLRIEGPPRRAAEAIARLCARAGLDLDAALQAFATRLDHMAARGLDLDAMVFDSEFGRNLEYYTGFVFQFSAGAALPLAGGGRYDGLLEQLGAPRPVPAMGAAIFTERLLQLEGTA